MILVFLTYKVTDFLFNSCRYIDGHHHKFPSLPDIFRTDSTFRSIFDDKGHKRKSIPHLETSKLVDHHKKIEALLSKSYMKSSNWKEVHDHLFNLNETILNFVKTRCDQNTAMQERHHSDKVLEDKAELKFLKPSSTQLPPLVIKMYKALNEELDKKDCFEIVNVYIMAPDEKVQRFRYLHGIQVSVPTQLYRIPHRNAAFIWKVPNPNCDEFLEKTLETVQSIKTNFKDYHTRAMRKKVIDTFKNIRVFDRAAIHKFYDMVSNDENTEYGDKVKDFEERIKAGELIESIFDDEQERQTRGTKFENFFSAAQQLLDDSSAAVADERRHNNVHNRSPLFVSLRNFYTKSIKKMEEMFPEDPSNCVPSEEWFRRQMVPKSEYSNTAKSYTGRFQMRWTLQKRLLRKQHVDHHYGSMVFRYFKTLAQK